MYLLCCRILGIKPGSDEETIKAAYRKAAKELHPDVNSSEKASEYFVILHNAYEYLIAHPYKPEETETMKHAGRRMQQSSRNVYHPVAEDYTLTDILKGSSTARVLFIGFHILFLIIGFTLIIRSVYGAFFFTMPERTQLLSKYIAIGLGFVFGVIITSIFLYTGISYFRNR